MPIEEPLPPFDKRSKCVKCGYEIPEPVEVPQPDMPPKDAKKDKEKKEEAAAPPPPMQMPVTAPDPTVAYCNGLECPWHEDEVVEEHMHQFCDVCGYEWLSMPLG